jgi:hypothetical protein
MMPSRLHTTGWTLLLGLAAGCSRSVHHTSTPEPVAAPVSYAWWVTARFAPGDSVMHGLTPADLDPTWVAASPLSRSALPPEARTSPGQLDNPSFAFSHEGDLNHDGHRDVAFVGTYRARDGRQGKFVAVLTQGAQGRWERAFVTGVAGAPGFSVLQRTDSSLLWWDCMACDVALELRWTGNAWHLSDLTCCGREPHKVARKGRPS